ncbi:TPA: hypothetical protein KRE80_002126 [Clostridioides difficile]|nr:hypothetical protein [Clostridioides difficile]
MNIGGYTLVKKQIVEEEVRQRDDRIKLLEYIESKNHELIEALEEQLIEYRSSLDVYGLFIDCILNKETRKAIAIYNRTKSIRIRQKCLNSIPIKRVK